MGCIVLTCGWWWLLHAGVRSPLCDQSRISVVLGEECGIIKTGHPPSKRAYKEGAFLLMVLLLASAVFVVAFFYASVGFGGATGYLAVMSLFDLPPALMASTALMLNLVVSSVSFGQYAAAGHFRWRLLWPFLLTSIPAAFLGGMLSLHDQAYFLLLYGVLTFVMLRMLFSGSGAHMLGGSVPQRALSPPVGMLIGALIGLLSGALGIGGGVFLSPLIVLMGWGTGKEASSVAAAFIFVNSASGLVGRVLGGNFLLTSLGWVLLPVGILAAFGGAYLGARRFSEGTVRRLLGLVLLVAIGRYFYTTFFQGL